MSNGPTPGEMYTLDHRLGELDRNERVWAHELAKATNRADDLAARLDVERSESDRLRADLLEARAETNAQRTAYEDSISWRVTRPLRKATQLLRRRST